jgi:hypothetical protein
MKFYQSPLLIISTAILLYGAYMFMQSKLHPGSWAGLIAFIAFIYGGIGLICHFVLRLLFHSKKKV